MAELADIKRISVDEFLEISKDEDFLKAMSTFKSFNKDAEGSTLVFTGRAEKQGNLILFPITDADTGIPTKVSQYRLNTLKEEVTGLTWAEYSTTKQIAVVIKLKKFTRTKSPAGKYYLPKFVYDLEKVAELKKQPLEEIERIYTEEWDDLTNVEKQKRRNLSRWLRSQDYSKVVFDEFLTDAGNLTKAAEALIGGEMTFTVVEAIDIPKK